MITIYGIKGGKQIRKSFNVPADEYLSVIKLLKKQDYNWYTVDKGQNNFNPDQMTLDFGEIQ